jgi:hypothetical protein
VQKPNRPIAIDRNKATDGFNSADLQQHAAATAGEKQLARVRQLGGA